MRKNSFIFIIAAALLALAGCRKGPDGPAEAEDISSDVKIPTALVFSFPEVDGRGIDAIRLIPYSEKETGEMLSLTSAASPAELFPASGGVVFDAVDLPGGTSAALVYAKAADSGTDPFKNGALDVSGFGEGLSPDGITFAPVPVYTKDSEVEGKLLAILNAVADAKPSEDLSDGTRPAFKEVTEELDRSLYSFWTRFTTLDTGSSFGVESALLELCQHLDGFITAAARVTVPNAYKIATAIRSVMADYCSFTVQSGVTMDLRLNEEYRGFPSDVRLPDGAVRIAYDPAGGVFKTASKITDYVYPACRQYFADSPLRVSKTAAPADMGDWTWAAVLDAFADGASVKRSTVSAALENPVRPGVARLEVKVAGLAPNGDYKDVEGYPVDVTQGFSLTAILIGGQKSAAWDFAPKGTKKYAVYGKIPSEEVSTVKREVPSAVHAFHLLPSDQTAVNVALEFVNNGSDFTGEGNRNIRSGGVFYLLGTLNSSGEGPLFTRGGKVTATFTVQPEGGFSKAVQLLPDLNTTENYAGAFTVALDAEEG